MRNILLLLSLMLCANICQAQFQKGQKLIGGQIGFSLASDEANANNWGYTQNSSVFLTGSLSRFKSSGIVNGWGLSYQYFYNHLNNASPNAQFLSYQHSMGVFLNKTKLLPLAHKLDLSLTGTGGLSYTFGKLNSSISGSGIADINAIMPYISGSLGVWYQLGEKLLLTCDFSNLLTLSYSHSVTTYHYSTGDTKNNGNHFNMNTGLSGTQLSGLVIGIRYVLK